MRVSLQLEPFSLVSMLHTAHDSTEPMDTIKDLIIDYHVNIELVLMLMKRVLWEDGIDTSHPLYFIIHDVKELRSRRGDDDDCRGEFAFYATSLCHMWPLAPRVKPIFYAAPNQPAPYVWLHPTEYGMVNVVSQTAIVNGRWRLHIKRRDKMGDMFPLAVDLNPHYDKGASEIHIYVSVDLALETFQLTHIDNGGAFFILLTMGATHRFVRAVFALNGQSYPVSLHS